MLTIVVLVILIGFLSLKAVRLPGIALVGLYCMFAVEQWAQSNSQYFVDHGALINTLFALVILTAFASKLYRSNIFSESYPLAGILILLLFTYALLTTFWTSHKVDVQALWLTASPYIILQVLIAPMLVSGPGDFKKIFSYQLFIGGCFAALLVLFGNYDGRVIVLGDGEVRGGNPLAVAEMAGITIICAVMIGRLFRGDILVKLLITGICLVAIIKSGSRGQLIGLVIALVIAYPVCYSVKNPKVFAASAIAALAMAFFISIGLETFWAGDFRWSSDGLSNDYNKRIVNVVRLINIWLDDPVAILFGLGNSASYDPAAIGGYPHIVPIEILVEEGVFGGLLYLWVLLLVVRESIFALRRSAATRDERSSYAILIGIVVYLFMLTLKQGSLIGNTQFFMAVIIFTRVVTVARSRNRKNMRLPVRRDNEITSKIAKPINAGRKH